MATVVTYPLDKSTAGPAYWKTMMSYAAAYPVSPSKEDKIQFKIFFKNLLKSFPCASCREHSKQYILQHPPETHSRKQLFDWMCGFENHIRQEQGKEPLTCKLAEAECKTCELKDLHSTFKDFKLVSIKVFEELCKREKIPMPTIVFAPCPSAPFTSCTHMEKDLLSGKVKQDKSVVHLNPNQYSPRTIYHEFLHYAFLLKGKEDIGLDEWEVERIAQDQMDKEFPYDVVPAKTEEPVLIMKDTPLPISLKPRNYLDELNADIDSNFPMYAKYKQMQMQQKIEEKQASETGGVLSIFDSLYQPLEESFGLTARALNEMHTSNILAASATTLMHANLSPFGSAVTSLITGLSLLGAGVMAKKNLSIGDRRFLSTMGAYFLWSNIENTNPKISNDVIIDAKRAGEAAKIMDFEAIKTIMVESPEKKALTAEAQAQAIHQQKVAARSGQRGPGGRSGGIQRAGSRPMGARPDILRRMEQRAAGLPDAPNVAKFKEFPTRRIGRGFGGEFTPNYSEGYGYEAEPSIAETLPTTNSIPFWSGEETEEFSDLV